MDFNDPFWETYYNVVKSLQITINLHLGVVFFKCDQYARKIKIVVNQVTRR